MTAVGSANENQETIPSQQNRNEAASSLLQLGMPGQKEAATASSDGSCFNAHGEPSAGGQAAMVSFWH